jgi:hypothetical protein
MNHRNYKTDILSEKFRLHLTNFLLRYLHFSARPAPPTAPRLFRSPAPDVVSSLSKSHLECAPVRLRSFLSAITLISASIAGAQTPLRPTVSVALDPDVPGHMLVSGTAPGAGDLMICPLLTPVYSAAVTSCFKSTTLKDHAYSDSVKIDKWKFVTVYQGSSFAIRTIAVPSNTAVAAATAALKNDLPIAVDQPYCDTSLPYLYQSTLSAMTMQLGAKPQWASDLNIRVMTADAAVAPKIKGNAQKTAAISVVRNDQPPFNYPMPSSAPDGALVPGSGGTPDTLYDDGEPLLSAALPTATSLNAQRLLVRTLVSPNAASIACSYPYLTADSSPAPVNGAPAPLKDANGNPTNPISKGALYHFSLNDAAAPQYYIINIVRWKDAPTPSTVADTDTIPFFTVASDDWYLLNYSDNSDNMQDITQFKPWHHFTPSIITGDTLRMIGSKRVAFLGIHLAPASVVDKASQPLFGGIAPTEQAWYDNIKLKYTIHADSVQSIQMQDLSTLITILATSANLPPAFIPPAPPAQPPPPVAAAAPTLNADQTVSEFKLSTDALSRFMTSAPSKAALAVRSVSPAALATAQKDAATLSATLTSFATEITAVNAELAKVTQPALTLLGLSLPTAPQAYGCTPPASSPLLSLDTTSTHPSVQTSAADVSCMKGLSTAQNPDDTKLKLANAAVQKDLATLRAMDKTLAAQGALATVLSGIYTETFTLNSKLNTMPPLAIVLRGAALPDTVQDYGCQPATTTPLLSLDMSGTNTSIATDNTIKTCLNALVQSGTPDTAKIAAATTAGQKDLDNLKAFETDLSRNAVISLYQGLYGAGVLTGMASLPASSISSPVNIIGTWAATFNASPKPKPGTGNAALASTPPADPQTSQTDKPVTAKPGTGSKPATATTVPPASKPASKPASSAHGTGTAHKPSTTSPHASHGPSATFESEGLTVDAADQPAPEMMAGATGADGAGQAAAPPAANVNQPDTEGGSAGATGTQDASAKPPCVVAATADNLGQASCSHAGTSIHDEGRSWFDISVGVGITGYKDVTTKAQTSGTGTVLVPSSVTRENAYGMLDVFFIPEDLVDPPKIGIPHIVAGLPFAGQVFDKPYFGVGETFNFPKLLGTSASTKFPILGSLFSSLPLKVRPVFGWVYNKESTTSTSGVVTRYRSLHPQWAIEISFGDVEDAVKTLSKSSSSK